MVIGRAWGLVVTGFVLAGVVSVAAQHSVLPFDGTTPTTVTGKVTRVLWRNPHTYLSLDVERDGRVERWTIESEAVVVLERLGWTKGSIATGDTITSTGARAKDGRLMMRCVVVLLADGTRLTCFPGTPGAHARSREEHDAT
jgi:hypothetical protein